MTLSQSTTFAQPDNRFRPPVGTNQFEVLLYTSPDYYHNITEPAAISELQEMARRHAFGLTWTTIVFQFDDYHVVWEHQVSGLYNRNDGVAWIGSNGTLVCNRKGYEVIPQISDGESLI